MTSFVLPSGFQFSQGTLQDYEDCRRRFLLRYVEQLEWPAPITARALALEKAMERGRQFHEFAYQDALGVDVSGLVVGSDDEVLQACWRNYQLHPPENLPSGREFHEVELSVPLAGYRLTAKLDKLIVGDDGRVVIVDWKTSATVPPLDVLRADWQTVVYLYVVVEGGHVLDRSRHIRPDDVSLLYWYALHPDELSPIEYSADEHARARARLEGMIEEIAGLQTEAAFAKTDDWSQCESCRYRSYCERGRTPADDFEIREDELELEIIFDLDVDLR